MLFLFLGILCGVLILYKIRKRDPQHKQKIDENEDEKDVSQKKNLHEQQMKPEKIDFLPNDINFTRDEINKRQQKILGNLNDSEKKLFLDYVKGRSKDYMDNKDPIKNKNDQNDGDIIYNMVINCFIIFGIGGLIYYYIK